MPDENLRARQALCRPGNNNMKENQMYRYQMISKKDENPTERQLAELTVEAVAIKIQIDDLPQIHFIEESSAGYIEYPSRIAGYCSHDGKYICICRGRAPKDIVSTAVHEARHAYQCQDANRHKLSVQMRERDAELFVYEFFGSHSDSGDAPTLMRTLNAILDDDLDRIWKKACASARAKLSRPAETQSFDDLHRRFAPVLKARSLAVQQFVDPNRQRLFPPGIEFNVPYTGLKVSY